MQLAAGFFDRRPHSSGTILQVLDHGRDGVRSVRGLNQVLAHGKSSTVWTVYRAVSRIAVATKPPQACPPLQACARDQFTVCGYGTANPGKTQQHRGHDERGKHDAAADDCNLEQRRPRPVRRRHRSAPKMVACTLKAPSALAWRSRLSALRPPTARPLPSCVATSCWTRHLPRSGHVRSAQHGFVHAVDHGAQPIAF